MFMHDATKESYSEALEQQAAMHANYFLVKLHACSVRCKEDQDMNAGVYITS